MFGEVRRGNTGRGIFAPILNKVNGKKVTQTMFS